jgi:hypothetical protein
MGGVANMKPIITIPPVRFIIIQAFTGTTGLRGKSGDMAIGYHGITLFKRIKK